MASAANQSARTSRRAGALAHARGGRKRSAAASSAVQQQQEEAGSRVVSSARTATMMRFDDACLLAPPRAADRLAAEAGCAPRLASTPQLVTPRRCSPLRLRHTPCCGVGARVCAQVRRCCGRERRAAGGVRAARRRGRAQPGPVLPTPPPPPRARDARAQRRFPLILLLLLEAPARVAGLPERAAGSRGAAGRVRARRGGLREAEPRHHDAGLHLRGGRHHRRRLARQHGALHLCAPRRLLPAPPAPAPLAADPARAPLSPPIEGNAHAQRTHPPARARRPPPPPPRSLADGEEGD